MKDLSTDEKDFNPLMNRIFSEVERLNLIFSFHETESELSQINRLSTGDCVLLSPEMNEVLILALKLYFETGGKFNVAIADVLVEAQLLPGKLRAYEWNDFETPAYQIENGRLTKLQNLRIDLGGIAKGYIVDACVTLLQSFESTLSGSVSAGGDLKVFGERQTITVRSGPREDSKLRTLTLCNQAIATSTPSPETAYIDTHQAGIKTCPSTAIAVAESCMLADAFTKIALLVEPEKAIVLSHAHEVNTTLVV